jgi:endonuclease-3
MSRPVDRANRVIGFLQELFETTYSFELEFLHKKGLKQATKHLSRYQVSNDYLGAWVTQRALGGHAIPIDPPTLRVSKRLGLIEKTQEQVVEIRNTLEHLIPKAKGVEFTDLISTVGMEYCHEKQPNCAACPLAKECQFATENAKPASKKPAVVVKKSK